VARIAPLTIENRCSIADVGGVG
jgi:hypothetical protein